MPRRLLNGVSIRRTAPLAVALPVLLGTGLVLLVAHLHAVSAADRLARSELRQTHARIADRVVSLLDQPVHLTRYNARRIEQGVLDPADLRAWRPALVDLVDAFEQIAAITWGDTEGNATWIARYDGQSRFIYAIKDNATGDMLEERWLKPDATIPAEPHAAYPYDLNTRPWYTGPLRAGEPVWSAPFAWIAPDGLSSTLGVSYGHPIRDAEGRVRGVVDAELTLHDLSRFLERIDSGAASVVYLVDAEGLLIATSTGAPILDDEGARISAGDSSDPAVAQAARALQNARIENPVSAADTRARIDGQTAIVVSSVIEHEKGLTWRAVTVAPERAILAEVQRGRDRSLLIGGVILLAALALGVALARFLSTPILNLVREAKRVGRGELDKPIHVEGAREFQDLSGELSAMVEDLRDRLALRHSLSVAMEVQQRLLPAEPPSVRGVEVAGYSDYCDETGGDYYDYLEMTGLTEDAVAIAVGDVMGHGVAAAMLMATARGILKSRATEEGSLAALLTHLNELLYVDTGGERFMTMLLLTVESQPRRVRWASAGHGPPLLLLPDADSFSELDSGGVPLGILEGESFEERVETDLPPGSLLLICTDGVWESRNDEGEQFGLDRVLETLRSRRDQRVEEIAQALKAAVERFTARDSQEDDVTFVIAKLLAPEAHPNPS